MRPFLSPCSNQPPGALKGVGVGVLGQGRNSRLWFWFGRRWKLEGLELRGSDLILSFGFLWGSSGRQEGQGGPD